MLTLFFTASITKTKQFIRKKRRKKGTYRINYLKDMYKLFLYYFMNRQKKNKPQNKTKKTRGTETQTKITCCPFFIA